MKQSRSEAAADLIARDLIARATRCTCGTYGHLHAKRCPRYSPDQGNRSSAAEPIMKQKPEQVQVGNASAYKQSTTDASGKLVTWWVLQLDGQQVGTMSAEQFAVDGKRALQAYNARQAFVPTPQLAGMAAAPREEVIRLSRDATVKVDGWTRELAAQEYLEGGLFANAVGARPVEQWATFERELFATLHGEPQELPADERAKGADWMARVLEQARQLPEWDSLKRQAAGDSWASGLGASRATTALSEALNKELESLPKEDPQRLQEEAEALADILGTRESPKVQAAELKAAQAALRAGNVDADLEAREGEIRNVLREALGDAADEIAEVNAGIGVIGGAPGQLGSVQAPREEIRRVLEQNPALRRIASIAGRLKIAARQKQRTKQRYVPETVVDVELGAEIQRLLPSEVMLLAGEETELLLYRKLLERNAQQYRLEGTEQRDRGPVVLCVDESFSMKGAPHEWAMGVALALLDLCVMQRRAFALVHFDSRVTRVDLVQKPAALKLGELVGMVTAFSGGGTAFGPPLAKAAELVEKGALPEADVILLTDGAASWGAEPAALKALGASIYGVTIGGSFTDEQRQELAGVAAISPNLTDVEQIDLVFGI